MHVADDADFVHRFRLRRGALHGLEALVVALQLPPLRSDIHLARGRVTRHMLMHVCLARPHLTLTRLLVDGGHAKVPCCRRTAIDRSRQVVVLERLEVKRLASTSAQRCLLCLLPLLLVLGLMLLQIHFSFSLVL